MITRNLFLLFLVLIFFIPFIFLWAQLCCYIYWFTLLNIFSRFIDNKFEKNKKDDFELTNSAHGKNDFNLTDSRQILNIDSQNLPDKNLKIIQLDGWDKDAGGLPAYLFLIIGNMGNNYHLYFVAQPWSDRNSAPTSIELNDSFVSMTTELNIFYY